MNAFNKDILRSIRSSFGRFIAIVGIVGLGVGFFAGMRMTCPDMNQALDAYFDNTAMMDLRVVSTLGMSEEDIEVLRAVEGVEAVMPAREMDVLSTIRSSQYVLRVHSLPASAVQSEPNGDNGVASSDPSYLNRLILEEGRWPTASGECVISADAVMNDTLEIGDRITFSQGSMSIADSLATDAYTIVGFVHAPYYVSSSVIGTTSIGNGTVKTYIYIPETDFTSSVPYTEAFITVAGAAELQNDSDEYKALVAEVKARIDELAPARAAARTQEVKAQAQQAVDDAAAEAQGQLDSARAQLDSAAATIASGQAELDAGQSEYDQGVAALDEARTSTGQQIADARAEAQAAGKDYQEQLEEVEAYLPLLTAAEGVARAVLEATPESSPAYELVKQAYEAISSYRQQAESGQMQLEVALELVAAALAQIDAAEAEAEAEFAGLQAQLDAAAEQLAAGRAELESGRAEYASGLAEYNEAAAEAEAQLAEAQLAVDEIAAAEWYVLDRTKNYGAAAYQQEAQRIDNIASFFPLIFFLVAALVALTTMTRMVEEERVLIGTYKALGYSKARVTSKYLIYVTAASVLGCLLGLAILPATIPAAIMFAYNIMYYVPSIGTPLDPGITALSAGLGIGITLAATWAAAAATLREIPASLMLPRAPKAGKRILLERIHWLWSRLSFSWKVTFRNLFLYKKRLLMTVVGIAGCTALLLTGLGLRGSIHDIIPLQYDEIIHHTASATVSADQSAEDRAQVEQLANDASTVAIYSWTGQKSMQICPEGRSSLSISIVVPQDVSAMSQLITWRNRESGQALQLTDEGVLLTEKAATVMNVQPGDTVRLYCQSETGTITDTYYDIPVAGVVENYVASHAYMTPALYEKTFGEPVSYQTLYMQYVGGDDGREAFSAAMKSVGGVNTVAFTDATHDTYRKMIKSVDLIVWVLIISAGALAFIVLYNLININICERIREIATLKVLGFLPREVSAYIYRETILLSLLGTLVGLALGIFLEGYVVSTAEVDQVMWGRTIHASSYILAFVLTMGFALIVMLFMHRKLRKVNMVESLKSIE